MTHKQLLLTNIDYTAAESASSKIMSVIYGIAEQRVPFSDKIIAVRYLIKNRNQRKEEIKK